MTTVLAADLGGTSIRVAAVSDNGELLHHVRRPTPDGLILGHLTESLLEAAGECADAASVSFSAVGAGVPANVALDGILHRLPNIPTLEGADLHSALTTAFELPIVIENDAVAASIGESWLGASRGVENSILVTLGTGVGGGIIVNGEPLRGPDGAAAKIGHICVEPDGHPCGCGSSGCIEQYASATALVRMASEAGIEAADGKELYELFQNGDTGAAAVFGKKMGRYLGITLGGLVNTFNPDMIVIGGGVAAAWDVFIEPLSREIKYRAFTEAAERASLVRSELGDNAGILGTARVALESLAEMK